MYTTTNFKTKKELKAAVAAGEAVTYFQPGPFGGSEKQDGVIFIEGPQAPATHSWYAQCEVKNGLIIKVK